MSENRLKGLVTVEEDASKIIRFPTDIGNPAGDVPEARKFVLLKFFNRGRDQATGKIKTVIALPYPEINDAVNVKYDNAEFDVMGAVGIGSTIGNASLDRLTNIAKTGVKSFNPQTFARVAADVALSGTPGLKAGVAKGMNTIQNPFITNVFNSVGFREFNFNFKLVPKSRDESDVMKNIITEIKKAMLPRMIDETREHEGVDTSQLTGIAETPDLLDMEFYGATGKDYTKHHTGVIKIRKSSITDFTVEYSEGTPTPTFFKDNAPFSANLSLSIKENKIYTRERLREDYQVNDDLDWARS